MNSILVLVVGIGILIAGYVFYGKWLAEQWGVDPKRKTPAFTEEDGVDYVPAKAPVLMGHHFSSIAGAGPINGPIQAAVFGWVPGLGRYVRLFSRHAGRGYGRTGRYLHPSAAADSAHCRCGHGSYRRYGLPRSGCRNLPAPGTPVPSDLLLRRSFRARW